MLLIGLLQQLLSLKHLQKCALVNWLIIFFYIYLICNVQERTKFNAKSIKYIFIDYANGVKEYGS